MNIITIHQPSNLNVFLHCYVLYTLFKLLKDSVIDCGSEPHLLPYIIIQIVQYFYRQGINSLNVEKNLIKVYGNIYPYLINLFQIRIIKKVNKYALCYITKVKNYICIFKK